MRAALLAIGLVACARDPMTPLDHAHLADETADDIACVEENRDAGRAAVDACRAKVHAAWDTFYDAGGAR